MRLFYILRIVAVLAVAWIGTGARAEAQAFGLGAVDSPDPILVNNSLTYTINVTNLTGFLLGDVTVTNALSGSFQFLRASSTQGAYTNSGNVVLFDLGAFVNGGVAQMTLTVRPTVAGFLTNQIIVTSIDLTNTVATTIVTQVTNTTTLADLAVTLTGPVQAVI